MLTYSMSFLVILGCLLYIVLHGYSLSRLLQIKSYRVASSYSLGIGYIALLLLLSAHLKWQWTFIFYIYIGTSLLCLFLEAIWQIMRAGTHKPIRLSAQAVLTCMLLIVVYVIYYIWAGAYDLVPSDTLRHLERIQQAYYHLTQLDAAPAYSIDSVNDRYIYYIYAVLWHLADCDINTFLHIISGFSGLLFLLALYWFVYYAAQQHCRHIALLGFLTCLIFVLHQGFAGFPYLRYYALSATLWMMPVYFLAILLIRDFFQKGLQAGQYLLIIISLVITSLYHIQETLFIAVTALSLLIYYLVMQMLDKREYRAGQSRFLAFTLLSMLLLVVIGFSVVYAFYISNIPKTPIDDYKVIDLADFIGLGDHLYILNPFLQFNQVVTHFGISVYIVVLCFFALFLRIPLLAAGLLIPLLTVFNPLFIDVFIRLRDVHVVYRFLYIVPFAFACAFFMVRAYERFGKDALWLKIIRAILIGFMLICLLPLGSIKHEMRYSRLPELGPVNVNQGLRHLRDVAEFLDGYYYKNFDTNVSNLQSSQHKSQGNSKGRQQRFSRYILTDPVTGYMLTAMTQFISPRYKFLPPRNNVLLKKSISSQDLASYRDWLLIVNLRDGGRSSTGALSTHWPEDVLKRSQYYSPALLNYIERQDNILTLLWEKDNVRIYRIMP